MAVLTTRKCDFQNYAEPVKMRVGEWLKPIGAMKKMCTISSINHGMKKTLNVGLLVPMRMRGPKLWVCCRKSDTCSMLRGRRVYGVCT